MTQSAITVVDTFIQEARKCRVLVIGETITDAFVDVSYEGQSMKSICPVFRTVGPESQQMGGALAIANHLRDFVASVTTITNHSTEIRKTRYVDVTDHKKHVEINTFPEFTEAPSSPDWQDFDVVLVADFGHGFCDRLQLVDGFHFMCQTNSNNFGFNRMSKWKHLAKRSVCLDLREASLQINRRLTSPSDDVVREIHGYEINTEHLFVTLGRRGSCLTDGKRVIRQDSYRTDVVDTIGAGDTFFAFSSLASHLGLESDAPLLVPALAASLSTTWVCNERSVTREYALLY